jgi:hypothetical protein
MERRVDEPEEVHGRDLLAVKRLVCVFLCIIQSMFSANILEWNGTVGFATDAFDETRSLERHSSVKPFK